MRNLTSRLTCPRSAVPYDSELGSLWIVPAKSNWSHWSENTGKQNLFSNLKSGKDWGLSRNDRQTSHHLAFPPTIQIPFFPAAGGSLYSWVVRTLTTQIPLISLSSSSSSSSLPPPRSRPSRQLLMQSPAQIINGPAITHYFKLEPCALPCRKAADTFIKAPFISGYRPGQAGPEAAGQRAQWEVETAEEQRKRERT